MIELLREEDFIELPEEPEHKWVLLEKLARSRFKAELEKLDSDSGTEIKEHYIHVVSSLAQTYEVAGIPSPSTSGHVDTRLHTFQLAVSRAETRIWAGSTATSPLGRITLNTKTKSTILDLTNDIEAQIDLLDLKEKRRVALHKRLEDFRREINQPKTRLGVALTSLAQLSTVVAMATTSLSQGPDAYSTILRLLGAEYNESSASDIILVEREKLLLLPPPPAQIEGPKPKVE